VAAPVDPLSGTDPLSEPFWLEPLASFPEEVIAVAELVEHAAERTAASSSRGRATCASFPFSR
jgi:hypothetical protein